MADSSTSEDVLGSVLIERLPLDKRRWADFRLVNIVLLGIAFMLIFSAFQTGCIVEQIIVKSAEQDPNSTFTGSGYASLAIIYASFSACNWIAPSFISVFGLKVTMIIGGSMYIFFTLFFLKLMTWALYLCSVLVGFGAAILWTAQGSFLTINSDTDTAGRNSGVFWAIFQSSLLIGNLYTYFTLHHGPHTSASISKSTRVTLYAGLSGACILGVITLFLLRTHSRRDSASANISLQTTVERSSPLTAFKRSCSLFLEKDMLMLSVNFAYTGIELTFWSGVYGACVGNNKYFAPDSAALVGIVGIFIGLGEIIGGALFGLFSKFTVKHGRDNIVVLGYVIHMITFFIIFLNMPDQSPLTKEITVPPYIHSNRYIAVLCAFLLGFGDASFNTQIYTILGELYPNDSSPAFALFKFVQSVAAAIAFAYSIELLLKWQLLILVVMGTAGTITYARVEHRHRHNQYDRLPCT